METVSNDIYNYKYTRAKGITPKNVFLQTPKLS